MNIIPNFAVFEGGDGSGTTTQLFLLSERFKNVQKPGFFSTFEPTDGEIGKIIRRALKNELSIKPETLAMLFAADRNEHIFGKNGILDHTNKGFLVVSDRYSLSSLVYQGIECGDELPTLLNAHFPVPEVTFFLDIEPEVALARMKERTLLEIYEYKEFQEKVRQKYISLIEKYRALGARVEILDARKSAQDIADQVWSIICQMPILNT